MPEPFRNPLIQSLAVKHLAPGLSPEVASFLRASSVVGRPGVFAGIMRVQQVELVHAMRAVAGLGKPSAVVQAITAVQGAGLSGVYTQHLRLNAPAMRRVALDGLAPQHLAAFHAALRFGFEVVSDHGEVVQEAVRQQEEETDFSAESGVRRPFASEAARRKARLEVCGMVAGIVFFGCFYLLLTHPDKADLLGAAGVNCWAVAGAAFLLTRLAFDRLYPPEDED